MARIGKDEGRHSLMLINRLAELGTPYGTLPVIGNLSNTINKTQGDIFGRLALIWIVHEGRGTQAIKKLLNKLRVSGDQHSVKILQQIEIEE